MTVIVVSYLFIAAGALLVITAGWLFFMERSAATWKSVPGRLESAEIQSSLDGEGRGSRTYRIIVTYEYEVDGRTFSGHRVTFGDSFWGWKTSRLSAEAAQKMYTAGQEVSVFYDPNHPERCTLVREIDRHRAYQLVAVGVILIAAAVAAMNGLIKVEDQ